MKFIILILLIFTHLTFSVALEEVQAQGRYSDFRVGNSSVMHFDPNKPFRFEFGRGSGYFGLETVVINVDGNVELYRLKEEVIDGRASQFWVSANLRLSSRALSKIGEAVSYLGLLEMKSVYEEGVSDGSQWVFYLKQGVEEKVIYFDNIFPKSIKQLAGILDSLLDSAGVRDVHWNRVESSRSGKHDDELWKKVPRETLNK